MAREYYSIPEVAAFLGISRIAVFKRVKKGQLPALRFGRNWAVPASAMEKPFAAGPGAAAPPPPPPSAAEKTDPGPSQGRLTSDDEMDSMGWD